MTAFTFKTQWRNEGDHWTIDGDKITDPKKLQSIRDVLEERGPIIVEHWFYRGSRSPDRLVFDDYDKFVGYLKSGAKAGDAIHVWDASLLLRDDNQLAEGKCLAEDGKVPKSGAY